MEGIVVAIVLIFIGLIVRAVMGGDPVTYPGRKLQEKFIDLGVVVGKTRKEIESIVGQPNSISAIAGGKILCQWMATGYHIALIFKDNICEGVSHESAN